LTALPEGALLGACVGRADECFAGAAELGVTLWRAGEEECFAGAAEEGVTRWRGGEEETGDGGSGVKGAAAGAPSIQMFEKVADASSSTQCG